MTVEIVTPPPHIETRPDETARIVLVKRIVPADRPKGTYVGQHRAPESGQVTR